MRISTVFLYDEPTVPEIKIGELANFISDLFHVKVETRKNIFNHFSSSKTFHDLAASRIFDTQRPFERHDPTYEEVRFEEESFSGNKETNIVMYDGFEFQKIITNMLPEGEQDSDKFHLACTNKLTCTFDFNDYRYHGRAVICSNPAIISTTGIIEAPAKPREYYLSLLTNMAQGLNIELIKNQFKGTYLEYHDSKLNEVIKGYALQALFYYISGDAFCELKDCRLYNAHWQSELLHSQIQVSKLCNKHQQILEQIVSNHE